jgi:CRP-like cAMP-binding protein
MKSARPAGIRKLRGLKTISWLSRSRIDRLAAALTVTTIEKREIIFDDKHSAKSAFILLSGVARITCRNRKGERILVIMVAPGMIPGVPPEVVGVTYQFRCEAITECQIGTIALDSFIEICLGITSDNFKQMATSYLGRWDLVQLRCSNFMNCNLEERLALTLLELSENFGAPNKQGIMLSVPARHQDLAELVGASRPRVTEHLIRFERNKWIVREDRHIIVKPERLEAFLEKSHSVGLSH